MEDNVNFDNEVLAYLSVRKDELIDSHSEYTQKHPEIREVLNDLLSSILLHKPVSQQQLTRIRTTSSFTPRSTSILSTQLHSSTSLLF